MNTQNNSPRTPGSNAGLENNDTMMLNGNVGSVNRTAHNSLPLFSEETEAAVLSCLIQEPDSAKAMLAKLQKTDFYDMRHKEIYLAIVSLVDKGMVPDSVSLYQWLTDKGRMEDAGGLEYVQRLPDRAPSAANFTTYLATLKDKALRREAIRLAEYLSIAVYDEAIDARALIERTKTAFDAVTARDIERRVWFRFLSPAECVNYTPPANLVLVGDCHITRGVVTVIAGPPGVGKSRAALALAVAGATGAEWFGLKTRCKFRTAILQNENGRHRLKAELGEIGTEGLNDSIRISEPPPFGMAFDRADFRAALAAWFEDWKPELVVFDPWNSAARDDGQRDYWELFQCLKAVLPKGDAAPALVIVAHTRKPKADDRRMGRALLNDVAGSHVLGSVPRSVFIMQLASDDPEDDRIVWTCCKNNDGKEGPRSPWHRRNGLFQPCSEFDWAAFDATDGQKRHTVTKADMEKLFEGGKRRLERSDAVKKLVTATQLRRTACYEAFRVDGRFAGNLEEDSEGLLCWTS